MAKLRVVENGMALCPQCGAEKDLSRFAISRSPKNTFKRAYLCKDCNSQKTHEYRNTETGFWVGVWNNLTGSAKTRNLEVNITKDDILQLWKNQGGLCALTGIPMQIVKTKRTTRSRSLNHYRASVDRIDSELGYVKGNIRLVCAYVNIMRSDMTDEQLRFWCAAILKGSNNG